MASWRKRKKAYDCVHRYESKRFLVTDDPYPIYNQEEYCKIGKYDFTWRNRADCDYTICDHCKSFKGSRAMNRKKNKADKEIKENIRFWSHCERACKQHGITPEEYADKFYRVSDYPIDTSIVNNILNDLPF